MKKYTYITIIMILSGVQAFAQTGINQVLEAIASNNQRIQAEAQLNATRKLEARTGIYLPNPTVELNQLWSGGSNKGNINELAVVQAFDFPSVYANKNKLAKLKSTTSDYQYAATRQQILLTAKQTCQEIIYLRKQQRLLENRLKNAGRLSELYRQRLANGDANQLELNKIQLEKINAQNASRLNNSALQAKQEELITLNGGIPINFHEEEFTEGIALPAFEQLETEYLAADPTLKTLAGEAESASREISLSRAQTLPKFDIGYRRNGGSDEKMNGFRIGMSIPLWENKNTVKKAKAQAEYAVTNVQDNTRQAKTLLRQLYTQALSLLTSKEEYAQALTSQQSEELLNKALEAGQISMIEYFVEITLLYDSMQNYLDIEKEYYNATAQLLQYQL